MESSIFFSTSTASGMLLHRVVEKMDSQRYLMMTAAIISSSTSSNWDARCTSVMELTRVANSLTAPWFSLACWID